MAHQLDKYLQKGGINIKPENRGKFTKAAKSRGLGVQEFARKVLANKDEYSPLLVKRANFARNAASWKQNGGAVLEDKEYVKDLNGNIQKLEGFPTHDDYMLVDEEGQYLESTPYNKGGVYMDGIQSVVSATHENRDSSDKSYTEEDEKIKIKKAEGKALGKQLGFNIKFKAGSPSKLLDSIYDAKEKQIKKFDIDYQDNLYAGNTKRANESILASIPSDEDIYDTVFSYQESLKDFDGDNYQKGGVIYVESKSDPRFKAYQDSLNLYKKTLNIVNPKNYKDNSKFNWFNKKGSTKEVEKFAKENNILTLPLNGKFPGKIQPVKTFYWGEGLEAPIYKKPIQKIEILKKNYIDDLNYLESIPFHLKNNMEFPKINNNFNNKILRNNKKTYQKRVINSEYKRNPDGSYGEYETIDYDSIKPLSYKKTNNLDIEQVGGAIPITILPMKTKKAQRGVLLNYPTMKGNRPNAQVKLNNGKVVNVDLVDNRSVSMDDIYSKDSVIVNKNKAIRFKKK